jgi:hypothetical protein
MYQLNPEFVHVCAGLGGILLLVGVVWDYLEKRIGRDVPREEDYDC